MKAKERNYKVVVKNEHNSDEYLLGFYERATEAMYDVPNLFNRNKEWIKDIDMVYFKNVDPEKICNPVSTDYSHYIRSLIPDDEWKRVMSSDASAEISENDIVCVGATYYNLSKMIPKDWSVIDIGSSYNSQSYLFKDHARYIAVEPFQRLTSDFVFERFKAEVTELYEMTCGKFIKEVLPTLNLNLYKTFAICNYVPNWHGEKPSELVRHTFKNVFTFYPL